MPEVNFGNQKIEFERVMSKSKDTITIRVDPDKSLRVLAPEGVSDGELIGVVKRKSRWIIDKFQRIDEVCNSKYSKREFVSGESFLFKGKLLRLKILKSEIDDVSSDTTTLFCKTDKHKESKYIQTLLESWYKQKAKAYFDGRVANLAKKLFRKPSKTRVRDQLLRWGSCTKNGEILLNWRIIMAPPSVIDYVIIHELAHLRAKNHTKEFWELVKNAMPNYEEKREWLRVNGPLLSRGI